MLFGGCTKWTTKPFGRPEAIAYPNLDFAKNNNSKIVSVVASILLLCFWTHVIVISWASQALGFSGPLARRFSGSRALGLSPPQLPSLSISQPLGPSTTQLVKPTTSMVGAPWCRRKTWVATVDLRNSSRAALDDARLQSKFGFQDHTTGISRR